MATPSIEIPLAGLLAGDAYLQEHTEEFNIFGGEIKPGLNTGFVKSLLEAVCQASGIELRMPCRPSPDAAPNETPHRLTSSH